MVATLHLVSAGPGSQELITAAARSAVESSAVVVAYEYYLTFISDLIKDKTVITMPLTKERERVQAAIESTRSGRDTALISSGDIGVYGLAPLLFEELAEDETFDVKVWPGVTASTASASLLGAPLGHDFVTLSLSDLLCPFEWIERRARAAALGDLCLALYNVQSRKRVDGIYKIIDLLLDYRPASTVCGIVRNAYREEQSVGVATLGELRQMQFDMFTCILIGNSRTARKGRFIYTPRGYKSFSDPARDRVEELPERAVWLFSGTADGNALANRILDLDVPVVISAATEYGAAVARQSCPRAKIVCGRLGEERRSSLLTDKRASLIVDATHPYAQTISRQLRSISESTGIRYLRMLRPESERSEDSHVHYCRSIEEAARLAADLGRRIFLSTGSQHIKEYLQSAGRADLTWFARVTPDLSSIERAVAQGVARQNIIAMQGPFSDELDAAIWRQWRIDVVVSKESGDTGGLAAKLEAARRLGIHLVIVERPEEPSTAVWTADEIVALIEESIPE